jgi:hypothetical protein
VSTNIRAIHGKVNDIKHAPKATYFRRKVKFGQAVDAVGELLELAEVHARRW